MRCVRGFIKRTHPKGAEYPFVSALLAVGGKEAGVVEFLIDTGGGLTTLSYGDALRLELQDRIDRSKCTEAYGVGGAERLCPPKQKVEIILKDSQNPNIEVRVPHPQVLIPSQRPKVRGRLYHAEVTRPSILGWDVLRDSRVIVDYVSKDVELCFPD